MSSFPVGHEVYSLLRAELVQSDHCEDTLIAGRVRFFSGPGGLSSFGSTWGDLLPGAHARAR